MIYGAAKVVAQLEVFVSTLTFDMIVLIGHYNKDILKVTFIWKLEILIQCLVRQIFVGSH